MAKGIKHIVQYTLAVVALLSASIVHAQNSQFDQWFLNNYLINPAITGIENYVDLQLGYRSQWVGIEGAPTTGYVSMHSGLSKSSEQLGFTPTPNTSYNSTQLSRNYKERRHHGVGGSYFYDMVGPFITHEMNFSYAYHLPVSRKLQLSAGLSGGIMKRDLRTAFIDDDVQGDPAVADYYSETIPVAKLGLWLYGTGFYAGLSAFQYFTSEEDFNSLNTYLTSGYRIKSYNNDFFFTPFAVARMYAYDQFQFDFGIKMDYLRKFWIGSTYRSTSELVVFAGFAPGSRFAFNYIFNSGFGNSINRNVYGTHEIGLNFRLNNNDDALCPCYLW